MKNKRRVSVKKTIMSYFGTLPNLEIPPRQTQKTMRKENQRDKDEDTSFIFVDFSPRKIVF